MKAHRTDGVSLSFGLIFLAVPVWWAIAQVTSVRLPALGWLAAGALILFGVVGLLSAIRSGRRAEVTAPAAEQHAEIVRELLDDPADRPVQQDPAAEPDGRHPA